MASGATHRGGAMTMRFRKLPLPASAVSQLQAEELQQIVLASYPAPPVAWAASLLTAGAMALAQVRDQLWVSQYTRFYG